MVGLYRHTCWLNVVCTSVHVPDDLKRRKWNLRLVLDLDTAYFDSVPRQLVLEHGNFDWNIGIDNNAGIDLFG